VGIQVNPIVLHFNCHCFFFMKTYNQLWYSPMKLTYPVNLPEYVFFIWVSYFRDFLQSSIRASLVSSDNCPARLIISDRCIGVVWVAVGIGVRSRSIDFVTT
jgi:hypothetical protein